MNNLKAICVSCRIGSEQNLIEIIQRNLGLTALYPMREQEDWSHGVWLHRVKPIIDGYIYVYTPDIIPTVKWINQLSMTRVLHYDEDDYALYGNDLDFAEWLWKNNGRIGVSEAIMEGKDFVILDGPMSEYKNHIQKINKQKRYAVVDMSIGGVMKNTFASFRWMSLIDGHYVHCDTKELHYRQRAAVG